MGGGGCVTIGPSLSRARVCGAEPCLHSGSINQIRLGAFLIIANVGTAVVLYPIAPLAATGPRPSVTG
jgi:hypothetical protein